MREKLRAEFPFLKDVYLETREGWDQLLFDFFTEVVAIHDTTDIEIYQIKSKFGELRLHSNLRGQALDILTKYEDLSTITCEFCGEEGKTTEYNGWDYTICESCLAKLVKNKELE